MDRLIEETKDTIRDLYESGIIEHNGFLLIDTTDHINKRYDKEGNLIEVNQVDLNDDGRV